MRCLFERTQCIAQGQEYKREQKHLEKVLSQNGYPFSLFAMLLSQKSGWREKHHGHYNYICIPYVNECLRGSKARVRGWNDAIVTEAEPQRHEEFVILVKKKDRCTVGCSLSAFNLGW